MKSNPIIRSSKDLMIERLIDSVSSYEYYFQSATRPLKQKQVTTDSKFQVPEQVTNTQIICTVLLVTLEVWF